MLSSTPQTEKTDAELVALSLKDSDHFYYLIKRYEEKLARYIFRLSGLSLETREDILQEVFIKAYRNLNDFKPNANFSSWIYRITHNEVMNYFRKNRLKQISLETTDQDAKQLINILESEVNIQKDLQEQEMIEKVQAILKNLPLHYREALILYYLEEKSYSEISSILRKPMGTIATLLNRAKKQFEQAAIRQKITAYITT